MAVMHLLIPFASRRSEDCRQALRGLELPHLAKLLSRLTPAPPDAGDEFSLSAPHERALAYALGLPLADGMIPWAAWQASQTGTAAGAWGFITPCHWRMGANHVSLHTLGPADLPAQESQALLASMQPYFAADGIELQYEQPTRWLARGAVFADLATASLDRVSGSDVAHWMPRGAGAATLQRLQSEMQMLLYHHPVNDARGARGAAPVNAFWLSGTGALPALPLTPALQAPPAVADTLRAAALGDDWATWAQAWSALDATECAALLATLAQGESVQLTLCGDCKAQTFNTRPRTLRKRLRTLFAAAPPIAVLQSL